MNERKVTRDIGSFRVSGSDGREYAVIEREWCIEMTMLDGRIERSESTRYFLTHPGRQAVIATKDGFVISSSGVKLSRM